MRQSIRIFDYSDDPASLLLEVVAPLCDEFTSENRRPYFVRHWQQGPHLKISILTSSNDAQNVIQLISDRVTHRLLQPSKNLDYRALLLQHQRLAELEQSRGPLTPLLPHGHVDIVPHDPRIETLGDRKSSEFLDDFYVNTNASALSAVDQVKKSPTTIMSIAFDLMVATVHRYSSIGIDRGFVSFRSHADAFLSWWPEGEGRREGWDASWKKSHNAFESRIIALTATMDAGDQLPEHVRLWLHESETTFARAVSLIEAGQISVDPPWSSVDLSDPASVDFVDQLAKSPFHSHALEGKRDIDPVWFAHYRLVLNYLYLQLTRIGLVPWQRFYLCHVIANSIEFQRGVLAHNISFPSLVQGVRYGAVN